MALIRLCVCVCMAAINFHIWLKKSHRCAIHKQNSAGKNDEEKYGNIVSMCTLYTLLRKWTAILLCK